MRRTHLSIAQRAQHLGYPEVRFPAKQGISKLCHDVDQTVASCAPSQFPDAVLEFVDGLVRHLQPHPVPGDREPQIFPVSGAVHRAFQRIHCEPQRVTDVACHACHHPLAGQRVKSSLTSGPEAEAAGQREEKPGGADRRMRVPRVYVQEGQAALVGLRLRGLQTPHPEVDGEELGCFDGIPVSETRAIPAGLDGLLRYLRVLPTDPGVGRMAEAACAHVLLEAVASMPHKDQLSTGAGGRTAARHPDGNQQQELLASVTDEGDADGDVE